MTGFEIALTWMMFVELLASNLVVGSTESEIPCQHRPCRCVNKLRVNCSHLLLTDIPSTVREDADILVLDVSSNQLSSLNASLIPSQLKAVQLSNNRIKTLDQSYLHLLQALTFLHLDNNNINAIHSDAFLENKRIEILTLSGNHFQFSETQNHVYKRPFLNAPGLRVLDISNCSFRIISGVMFAKLPQLEDLRLSYNHIHSLEEGTFQHLEALRSLLLRRNLLNKIQKGAFDNLSKLEVLDLAGNYLSFLDEPELFSPLIALRYLDLSGNGLKHLHQNIFSKLWSLKVLYLNRNLFNDLYEKMFHGLTQLTTLDVSDNSLHTLPRHTMFCENKELSYLKLSNSFMTCDNCSIWNIWKWKHKRNIRAFFANCNGREIEDFFNSYQKREEMLQSLTNCSLVPECESVLFEEMPESSSSSLHIYAITGTIFLLLLLSGVLVSVILFRRYFRSKRKQVVSVTPVSSVRDQTNHQFMAKPEEPYVSEELKKRQELFQKMEEERLKLQRELYFQHQKSLKRQQQLRYRETLERTKQERDAKPQILKGEGSKDSRISKTSQSGFDHNKRHSFQEAEASRLPSVADDEREWCRADTLPVRDKYKYLHSRLAATDKTVSNKKMESRRYSAGESYTDVIEDEYWHAKKSKKGSKSTDGILSICKDTTEVTFCPNAVPVCEEKLNDLVL